MIVLKLGGSVITEKDRPETVDGEALDTAAKSIGDAEDALVVVHGGGSFGHHHAERHDVTETNGTHDGEAIAAIHDAMCRLNDEVLAALRDAGTSPIGVHPLAVGHRDERGALRLPTAHLEVMIQEGFLPVIHGDLIAHVGAGATVLSGDEIVVSVAESLDADRVGLCSDVPGVLDTDGSVIESIDSYDEVAPVLGESESTDVTGGMAAKIRALTGLSAPANVFDLDGLAPFLSGKYPGTTVR